MHLWVVSLLSASAFTSLPLLLAQSPAPLSPASFAFEGVNVVDVKTGKLALSQRVVVVGNRIQAVGSAAATKPPSGARIVNAAGKYLIPGLWDMHTHSLLNGGGSDYPSYIAHGVTGTRDAGVLQTMAPEEGTTVRQAIRAGTRIGPRLIVPGPIIQDDPNSFPPGGMLDDVIGLGLLHEDERSLFDIDASDSLRDSIVAFAIARKRPEAVVKRLQAAGVDYLKLRTLTLPMYFAFAAAARRAGVPFGGHAQEPTPFEASDSGATMVDHPTASERSGGIYTPCLARTTSATIEKCRELAERFRRNGTWWVPTIGVYMPQRTGFFAERFGPLQRCTYHPDWTVEKCAADSVGFLSLVRRAGLPIVAGTDWSDGSTLPKELVVYVAEGLTPLEALQSATINPAKALRATDSLGTIEPGKLADLVLLDANPLDDIANTQKIVAVVANGRYFARSDLDAMIGKVEEPGQGD